MGAWGTGLYSDDYKDILGDGISEPEATARLLKQWKNELSDPDVAPVFWLTLADVQWNLGRLQNKVKQNALEVIENGSDLNRWLEEEKLPAKRRLVLERLRQKLNSPQPPEKKVKKRYVDSTDWILGDVYSLRLQSGKFALLHVIGFHQDKGGRGPVCEIIDWIGENVPDRKVIAKMAYKFAKKPHQHLSQFLFASLGVNDFKKEKLSLISREVPPKQKCGGYSVVFWRSIDKQFENFFGIG